MFPTLLDFEVQKQINEEHILKAAQRRQLRHEIQGKPRSLSFVVVQFGSWLERIGCWLQQRFSPASSLGASVTDARLQQC